MKKGSHHTEEAIKRMSEARKGSVAWNRLGDKPLSRREIDKRHRLAHPDKVKAKFDKYRASHPEKVREWRRQYHLRHRSETDYVLKTTLRKKIYAVLGRKSQRESYLGFLGCSIEQLRFYLEGKFTEGMTWKNHSRYGWHIDHVIPLAYFDMNDKDQARQAFHYTNLQPLWAQDNLKKWAKLPQNIYG